MAPCELIFATGNRAKLAQMDFVIRYRWLPITLVPARERFGDDALYDEVGGSAAAVALHGALTLAARLGVPVVTEDTTLHVAALNGEPGVRAGAFLIEHGRTGLLQRLDGQTSRAACISSAVAWAAPDGESQTWVANVPGEVTRTERWDHELPDWIAPTPENPLGGGYNAIFRPAGLHYTLAEIPPLAALVVGYREPNFLALLDFLMARQRRMM